MPAFGEYLVEVEPGKPARIILYETRSVTGRYRRNNDEHDMHVWAEPKKMSGKPSMPFMERFIADFYRK